MFFGSTIWSFGGIEMVEKISKERAFVGIAFQIQETDLTHNFDLEKFSTAVDSVFSAFYEQNKTDDKDKFVTPYFVFVQSSGIGKTKIMGHHHEGGNSPRHVKPKSRGILNILILLWRIYIKETH